MSVKIKITGVEKVLKNLGVKEQEIYKATVKEVESASLDLQSKAIERVPKFSSDLAGSSSVDIKARKTKIVGEIGFNTEYALELHEDMDIVHPIHTWEGITYDCQGDVKYLENPMKENASMYINNIKKKVMEVVKRVMK